MAKKTSTNKNKDEEAKAKVKQLLKGTSVESLVGGESNESPNNELDVKVIKKEKSMDWLQEQLDDALTQVEALENEIIYYKEELSKRQENPNQHAVVQDIDTNQMNRIIALYKHFENLYISLGGDPSVKIAYPQSGNGILDKFIEYFPELQNVKRYRYRGGFM